MISAVDLRAGMTFIQDGKLIKVMDASHHKPGKGNTVMRMKLRDVRTGATYDTTFRPDEKFEKAHIDTKKVQYLYTMEDTGFFMDLETYDQYEIPVDTIEDEMKFVLENMELSIQFYDVEVMIDKDGESTQFPIIGYKHHSKKDFVFTKDREEGQPAQEEAEN